MSYNLIDICADWVQGVSDKLLPTLSAYDPTIVKINYLYGPPTQIIKALQAYNEGGLAPDKYPLVALFQPFEETKGSQLGYDSIDNVRIIIGRQSLPEWLTPQRYDVNFIPVLQPIYEELLHQIYLDVRVSPGNASTLIPHTKVDWPYWDGGKDNNPFNDWLDVIEIKNTKLKINLKKC